MRLFLSELGYLSERGWGVPAHLRALTELSRGTGTRARVPGARGRRSAPPRSCAIPMKKSRAAAL